MRTIGTSLKGLIMSQCVIVPLLAFLLMIVSSLNCYSAPSDWKPTRNIEIVVPINPGGGTDRTARTIERVLREEKIENVPVVVVNKPGGGDTIGRAYLNQHVGDGHYISITSPTLLTNHITGKSPLNYFDFTPLAHLGDEYAVFVVKPDSPIKTGRDLLDRMKKDPSSLSFGTGGALGNPAHIATCVVMKEAGGNIKKLKFVIFNSGGESIPAVLGGHIDVGANIATNVVAHVEAGKMRALAVASSKRLGGVFANVPTWKEFGINAIANNWRGVIGPKGMNQAQIAYWDNVLAKVVETDGWKKDALRGHLERNYLNSTESKKYLAGQYQMLKEIYIELGLSK